MDKIWITALIFVAISLYHETSGQSDFYVVLHVKKYVEKGQSVTMFCETNVEEKDLYKVTWLRNGGDKLFEYIKGRKPPFRNFTIPGAEIDWDESNERQLTMKNLHFDAAGTYYCEVTTDTPIYTKESQLAPFHVILPQTGPPRITFKKRQFFIGEKLIANCTTSKAQPAPHITWLINGKKANESDVKTLHPLATAHRPKNFNKLEVYEGKYKNPIQQLRSMMPNRGEPYDFSQITLDHSHNYDNNFEVDRHFRGEYSNGDFYDNKPFDTLRKTHRVAHSRKYRRYVNDGSTSRNLHKATIASSQLSVAVAELEPGSNGKLEITCLATIPSHVGAGEQYADYKTYSVKIDIEKPELTSPLPPISNPEASTGNGSPPNGGTIASVNRSFSRTNDVSLVCLPTLLLLIFYRFLFSYTIL